MASTTSDLQLLGRKLGALDYNPDLYVKEIARRSVGGHDLLHQRNNIKVFNPWTSLYWTAMSSFCFQTSGHHGGCLLGPKLHPRVGFFGP